MAEVEKAAVDGEDEAAVAEVEMTAVAEVAAAVEAPRICRVFRYCSPTDR